LFTPDYKNILDVANNRRPERLPLYEHIISPVIMERILGVEFAKYEFSRNADELRYYFGHFCRFFNEMTYDTISYEFPTVYILPSQGAGLLGKAPGIIQSRQDFNKVDWDSYVQKFVDHADVKFQIMGECMPAGMKAIGGVANGVFEISEELVGLEYLSYMQADDPQLFEDLFIKIGDLMTAIWKWFLEKYGHLYCVCRFGDDLGYKSGLLTSPTVIRNHIIPQYKRIINMIHDSGHPFLWHSCGCIFDIMDDVIEIGIDAKHSNEDTIAPFDKWIDRYSRKIGLFGGIDLNLLCQSKPDEIFEQVVKMGTRFRDKAVGYALGSGNSIPDYVPVEGYLAMLKAADYIRSTKQ
jgi:uroporphyrinogen decarboxylase